MQLLSKIAFILIGIIYFNTSAAQGGGPLPMLTDDPGVVDYHKWEINTSVNSAVTNNVQLAVPYIDANYGIAHNLQLNAEVPYLITYNQQKYTTSNFGNLLVAIKFQFLNENKNFIAAGVYPQLAVTGNDKGFLFPLLLEKTIGKFIVGEDIGIVWGEHNNNSVQNGALLGYQISNKLQLLGEYFLEKNYTPDNASDAFINFGFRRTLSETFTLMGSFGTQVLVPTDTQKQYFISFLGIQSAF